MTTHHSPSTPSTPTGEADVDPVQAQKAFETVQRDMVLGGRAHMTAEYLRGLVVSGQLSAAGTPKKLAAEMWPDADPVVTLEAYQAGVAVGFYMAQVHRNPYLHRDRLARQRAELMAAGHEAMARMLDPVLATAVPPHPADGESEGWGHDDV